MAKAYFENELRQLPKGVLLLKKARRMIDEQYYKAIWSPVWETYLINDNEVLTGKRVQMPKDWTWCAYKDEVCLFHITSNEVVEYITDLDQIKQVKELMPIFFII